MICASFCGDSAKRLSSRLKGFIIDAPLGQLFVGWCDWCNTPLTGAIKIALFENRLEIFNPGSFPGLVDINNLGDGTTYFRNPVIGKIARRMEYIEKLGSGINVIFESCKVAGLRAPEFYEGADSVKIIFYFSTEMSVMNSDEENILKLFSRCSEVTISDIMKFLNVSRNTATRKLSKLLDSGKIDRTGKGPAVKYRLSSEPQDRKSSQ